MKGWLLRQPARSRHSKDITSASARWAEGALQCDVSYRERSVNSIANFRQRADGCVVMGQHRLSKHLHALRRQSRRTRIWRKLREKCNRDPDEAEKDRKATPNQDGDARPVAKINESNAGCHTEEGQTDQEALSPNGEGSHRRRKFRGGARQLDKQQTEQCD